MHSIDRNVLVAYVFSFWSVSHLHGSLHLETRLYAGRLVAGDALTNEPGQLIKDVASLLALSVLLARELFAVIVEVEDLLLVLRVHTLGATIGSKHALNRGAGVGLIPIDLQIACCAENFGEIEPAQLLLGKGFVTPALQMLTKLGLFV